MQVARAQSAEVRKQAPAGSEKEVGRRAAARSAAGLRPSGSPLAGERLLNGGRALDEPARSRLETGVRQDLGGVRVHDDAAAAASARALGARAFALGDDIVFGTGEYRPSTSEGERLLAHEVAHVAHARSVPVLPGVGPADTPAERGAAAFAHAFAATQRPGALAHHLRSWGPAWQLQRQPPKGTSPLPPHVTEFEDILKKTLFPKDPAVQKVKVEDLTPQIHFPGLFTEKYVAWTNAATKIFVRDPQSLRDPNDPPLSATDVHDFLIVTAVHEAVHLRQFAKVGRPPQSYAEMVLFEAEAYEETVTWLGSKQGTQLVKNPDILDSARTQSKISAKAFRDELARVKKLSEKDREAQLKAFLLGKNTIRKQLRAAKLSTEKGDGEPMLPPHKKLGELYGP